MFHTADYTQLSPYGSLHCPEPCSFIKIPDSGYQKAGMTAMLFT
jgi:hypothetical protein